MAANDGEALTLWQQAAGALVFLLITAAGMVQRYFSGKQPKEVEKEYLIQQAEILDATPLRELARQLQKEFPKASAEHAEMLVLLRRLDVMISKQDQDREVQRRVEDERLRDHLAQLHREAMDREKH